MNTEIVNAVNYWFDAHIAAVLPDTVRDLPIIESRFEHIRNVMVYCRTLGEKLAWPEHDIQIAELIGLLHDIGRFTQFIKYHTLIDADSVNHAKLAYAIVKKSGVLAPLPLPDRAIIMDGIRYHNDKKFANKAGAESMPFIKLIRDTDKLDKLRVAEKTIQERRGNFTSFRLSMYSDGPVNPKVLAQINKCKTVSKKYIGSEIDFRLMQLSLVFDIQYDVTYHLITESGIVNLLITFLPDEKVIRRPVVKVAKFLDEKKS